VALAVYAGLDGPRQAALLFVGGVAVALLALGLLLDNATAVTGGVALLACQFILSLYVRGVTASVVAAIYGSALLLVAELAHWSLQLGVRHRGGGDVLRWRAAATVALVAASLAIGLSAAAISQVSLPGGIALTAAGIGAVLAAMAIVALLLWERGASES
jgi:hypothetical protein